MSAAQMRKIEEAPTSKDKAAKMKADAAAAAKASASAAAFRMKEEADKQAARAKAAEATRAKDAALRKMTSAADLRKKEEADKAKAKAKVIPRGNQYLKPALDPRIAKVTAAPAAPRSPAPSPRPGAPVSGPANVTAPVNIDEPQSDNNGYIQPDPAAQAITAMSAPQAPVAQVDAPPPSALANRTVTQQSGAQPTVTTTTPSGVINNMTNSPFFQTYSGKYPKFNLGKRQ